MHFKSKGIYKADLFMQWTQMFMHETMPDVNDFENKTKNFKKL